MTLTAADVAEIMRLVEESAFDELMLELNGVKLHLRRTTEPYPTTPVVSEAPSVTASVHPAAPDPQAALSARAPADPNTLDVLAPLLGMFYRAPKPGAPPFVEVGTLVTEDTIVGIIEVMKLMNPVRAGVHGTVAAILCQDGALAEYGQVLMRVSKVE